MSAIWGVWHRDKRPRAGEDLRAMQGQLAMYGQDRADVWPGGPVGLGCCLSFATPEDDFDRQPLHSRSGCVLVAHVRLDNREELADALSISTATAATLSDAHLLLAAWEHWRTDLLPHLIGEFAFAVWDSQNQTLFCARDPLGGRPLHYLEAGSLFAFATAPKGLHALPEAVRELNPSMLTNRLAMLPETGEKTFFARVVKLPPGHSLTVTGSGMKVERYWSFDLCRQLRLSNDAAYEEAFVEKLDLAVRSRLRSRGPIATSLSGGLDSSSVTSSAALQLQAQGQILHCYTGVPAGEFRGDSTPGRFANEGEHAGTVAAMYPNIRHFLVSPVQDCPIDLMPNQHHWTDTPGGNFNVSPYAEAYARIHRRHGIQTLLCGTGGNLTISYNGLSLLPQLVAKGRWIRWQREARGLAETGYLPGWRSILFASLAPFVPLPLWKHMMEKRSAERELTGIMGCTFMNPRMLASGELAEISKSYEWDYSGRPFRDGREMRARLLQRRDLASWNPAGSLRSGVDLRDPTMDLRVVEFLMAVPEEQFLRNGVTKSLLRRAMRHRISPRVLQERRRGFVGADWHLRIAPFRDRFAGAIDDFKRSAILDHILDLPRMSRLIDRWPTVDWSSRGAENEYCYALGGAMAVGQFARWVEQGQ